MEKKIRLDKFLSNQGCGSRSEVRKYIFKGQVSVDHAVVRDIGFQVPLSCKTVEFNGKQIVFEVNAYLMLNKPEGVITATEDTKDTTVLDLIEHPLKKQLFPVGRLDKDTTGLLLITNDGDLSHQLLSPKKHVDKTYIATINGSVDESMIEAFKEGVTLDDGYKTLPAVLSALEQTASKSSVKVIIQEGKFHQIKRMFQAVNREVLTLKRIQMGTLCLDESLKPGEFRPLTEDELTLLKQ